MDAETVAKGLSEAQKRYLREAVLKSPICGYDKRWMTFPPPNTHMVLRGGGKGISGFQAKSQCQPAPQPKPAKQ